MQVYYFTRTGRSKKIAEDIAAKHGTKARQIDDHKDWSGKINYMKAGAAAMGGKGIPADYEKPGTNDDIVVVFPLWAGTMPPAVKTFADDIGGDKITARFMRQDFFEYVPQFKLLIVGNHQPTLRNVDDAARRRFNIIPFIHKPANPDPDLEAKLRAELPAIFRWAIDGCLDWQRSGLVRPASVTAATREYFDSQDLFGRWIEECCVCGPKEWTAAKALYESWVGYAKANGEEPGDIRKFGPMLGKTGFSSEKRGNVRGWRGISLPRKEEWQDAYDR